MRKRIVERVALGLFVATVVVAVGCGDTTENGRATASRLSESIYATCGVAEGQSAGGPRTITPIDLDGTDGPSGYLVTCVNGRTEYVAAVK